MTTVLAPNVGNVAIEGTFDDCQDMVKALFADAPFRAEMSLSAVNSINWARIAAQIPYYVAAALALGAPEREVAFAVPTGNFGNILAAWAARRMGLPVARLIVGSNRNDILARFLDSNDMSMVPVEPSLSPSMDIQVSSNFERLLFELLERDPAATARTMRDFRVTGNMTVAEPVWKRMRSVFHGFRLDDPGTVAEIRRLHDVCGYLADPHSAIGIAAARAMPPAHGVPTVAMATAHPAKFPDAIEQAIGVRPALPPRLADLMARAERFVVLPNDLAAVEANVRALVGRKLHITIRRWSSQMKRRFFLAGSAGLTLAAPAVRAAGNPKVLKFVPQADIALLDPHFSSALVTRNHSHMVYDQLYGVDDAALPRPQMAAGHVIEDDGKTWKITLREGLRFHDASRCWRATPLPR